MSRAMLTWFMSPRRDMLWQWWHGYQKVRMVRCEPEVKQAYLDYQNSFLEPSDSK